MTRAVKTALTGLIIWCFALMAQSAPYAAVVMDARTGEVLHSRNADTKLHPASLTKMMTLYLAFKAVESGRVKLDQKIRVSRNAASEPCSCLGLREGTKITVRYLIRAAAIKSANDAATALGEAIAGSEAKFTAQMTAQARALGMKNTTFKNAHGLTTSGHMSTARDMTILGRRLMYDFPEYYHLFSRRSADAGLKTVPNTNRRLLANYRGADGIKTGFTNAAGFNLVASAERGNKRIIATMFGGRSSASRNLRVAELLDMGFGRTPNRYAKNAVPAHPTKGFQLASAKVDFDQSIRILAPRAPADSIRPKHRPSFSAEQIMIASVAQHDLEREILAAAQNAAARQARIEQAPVLTSADPMMEASIINAVAVSQTDLGYYDIAPKSRVVVDRSNEPRGGGWRVELGSYETRFKAEKVLLRTALVDLASLEGALRSVVPNDIGGKKLYRAEFVGLSASGAQQACARLAARNEICTPISPES